MITDEFMRHMSFRGESPNKIDDHSDNRYFEYP